MFRHHIRATLIAVAVLVPAGLDAQARIDDRFSEGRPPVVIAHRSAAMGGFPENSLAWIDHAIGRGIDMVHINPQLTADDTYVLMHDPTLNRTTDVESVFPDGPPGGPTRVQRGGKDYVRDYDLSEIRTLKLVNGTDGGVHSVPTLGEALDLVDGRLLVRLGLKSYEVENLAAALAGRDTRNMLFFELYFSGTDQSKLRRLMEETGIDASVSLFRTRDALGDLDGIAGQLGPGLRLVSVDSAQLTPEFIARARELGVTVAISGWDGPEDAALLRDADPGPWRALLERGFAASTDQPDLLLDLLGR